jgi:hypothetical protein
MRPYGIKDTAPQFTDMLDWLDWGRGTRTHYKKLGHRLSGLTQRSELGAPDGLATMLGCPLMVVRTARRYAGVESVCQILLVECLQEGS